MRYALTQLVEIILGLVRGADRSRLVVLEYLSIQVIAIGFGWHLGHDLPVRSRVDMIGVAVGLAAPVGILAPIAVHQSVHAAAAFAVQMWRATVSRVRTRVPTNRTWSTIEGATPVVVATTMVFVGLDMAVPAYAATAASLLAAPTWILVRAHAPLMWRVIYAVIAASLVATAYQIALAGLSAGPAGLIALPTLSYLFGRLAFWWMRYAFVDVAAD